MSNFQASVKDCNLKNRVSADQSDMTVSPAVWCQLIDVTCFLGFRWPVFSFELIAGSSLCFLIIISPEVKYRFVDFLEMV